jgi:hypothetical protein
MPLVESVGMMQPMPSTIGIQPIALDPLNPFQISTAINQ